MCDYAELVKQLRSPAIWDDNEDCVACEMLQDDAADAIEELLAKNNELWIQLHVEGHSLISELPKEVE